jgi:hypothetical protein
MSKVRPSEALARKRGENEQAEEPTDIKQNCGRGDLGGKQICGPEHKGMTAASKNEPVLKSLYGELLSADLVTT